jgi:molybdopterin converting factor small subunit
MIDVTVEFHGTLRKRHGERRVITLVTGALSSLMQQLPDTHDVKPNSRKHELVAARAELLILVNGVEVSVYSGREPILKHGDVVTLIPVAHGG